MANFIRSIKITRNPTAAAWILYSVGYIALLIVDITMGLSFGTFRAVVIALMIPSIWLLYKGTLGKGGTGMRLLLVITQFWVAYALSAFIYLIVGKIF